MKVIVFRPGDAASKKLGADTVVLSEGKIVSVKDKTATINLTKKVLNSRPEFDRIITK